MMARDTIWQLNRVTPCYPPYYSDLAPTDYHLLRSLDNHLCGKSKANEADLRQALTGFFASKTLDFYYQGTAQLEAH